MSQDASLPGQIFNQLHSDWQQVLAQYQGQFDLIEEQLQHQSITPEFDNICRAFSGPISAIKVVIFGQDPYPTPGYAHGLAFSVAAKTKVLPKSLINIFKELATDCEVEVRTSGDLSDWSQQGVLLLNRILTTVNGQSLAHQNLGWQVITDAVAAELGQRDVVAICWGKSAGELSGFFRPQWVLSAPHPSPLSAHRGFFGSKPFSKTNRILVRNNSKPIKWS